MSKEATKLVLIVCEQGVEPDVMGALRSVGVSHYTRWTDCTGSGETGTREGTAIWPGLNSVVMVVMDAALVAPLHARLREVCDSFPVTPGLKMIVTDAVIL
jgi:hypothetical protein